MDFVSVTFFYDIDRDTVRALRTFRTVRAHFARCAHFSHSACALRTFRTLRTVRALFAQCEHSPDFSHTSHSASTVLTFRTLRTLRAHSALFAHFAQCKLHLLHFALCEHTSYHGGTHTKQPMTNH